MTLKHYEVCSPEYLDQGCGWDDPPEYGADFAFVEAESPAKAKAAALRLPEFSGWRDGADNPFVGLTVRLSRCAHGRCYCDRCEACPQCEAESDLRTAELLASEAA